MGILNSCLFVFIYRLLTLESGRVMAQVKPTVLGQLPIRKIDSKNRQDVTRHDQLVKLVKQRIDLHRQGGNAKTPQEQKSVDRLIEANDVRINELIYGLYDLSPQEIEIVEANT